MKEEILDTGCSNLYSSVSYKVEQSLSALIFAEVELEWWMDGICNCSENANCVHVISSVTEKPAYRCECTDGFVGDGFRSGRGCSKVHRKSVKPGLLAGVITAGASIMLLLAFFIYRVRRRQNSSKANKITRRLLSETSFNVPFYPYRTIEKATENFSETHRLGTGAYGTVYVGTLSNGNLIAVKKIKHPDPETISQVMNEVKMISSVSHPNLVHLLGCCIDKGEQILVYEFMPNGTLSEHLQRQRGPGLPWTIRLAIATETAKALAYLHTQVEPPIYHRDIKSSNILLDFQFNAKIADFGLSRSIMTDCSHISTAPQGTPGYVDPQYHQNYHLSDKSDVYSFGVVLMEIITAMRVVDFNRGQSEINLAALAVDRIAKGKVEEIVDPFLKVKKDGWVFGSVHKVAELAFRCLAFHRDMRPSMVEVADELEQIRVSVWAPEDGEVEMCTASPLVGDGKEGKSGRVVFVSRRVEEEKVNSPVSVVQDNWKSEESTPSSSSLLGYPTR